MRCFGLDAENRDRVSPPHPALRASQLPPALRATSLKEGGFKAPSLRELSAKLTEGVDKLSAKLTEGEDMLTDEVDMLPPENNCPKTANTPADV